jgi:hypothetical protein
MSWDLFACRFPKDIVYVDDVSDDFEPPTIGTRAEIIYLIQKIVPMAYFSNPELGTLHSPDFDIEVELGGRDIQTVNTITFFIRGGETATGLIADILAQLDLRAVDTGRSDGRFFDPSEANEGFLKWKKYRDQIVLSTLPNLANESA